MSDDTTNQEFGKVLIHGHKEFYITNTEMSIFDNDTYIGKINRNELFQYKVNQDTILVFKSGSRRAEVKVRFDVNNEIFLSYNSNIVAKVIYTKNNIDYNEAIIEIKHKKYLKHLSNLYYERRLTWWLCFILFFIVLIEMNSSIFKWILEIILLYGTIEYQKNKDFKHLAGPRYLYMTDGYDIAIMKKLIPRLHQYLEMSLTPVETDGVYQTYTGRDENNKEISFTFYITHSHLINKNNYRKPMLVIVNDFRTKTFDKEIGEIDLTTKKNVNKAIELIVSSLDLKPRVAYSK